MCFDSSAVTIGGKGKIVVIDGTGTVLTVVYDGQHDGNSMEMRLTRLLQST
jgi:hypothetical protein